MFKYKKYLLTGGKVPRSTLYYRKKKQQQQQHQKRLAQQESGAGTLEQTHCAEAIECHEQPLQHSDNNATGSASTDTDNEAGPTECVLGSKRKKLKKRKPQPEVATNTLSSSDELHSSSDADHSDNPNSPLPQPHPPRSNSVSSLDEGDVIEDETDDNKSKTSSRAENVEPLCPCTDTTVDDVLFMTLTLGLRHGLSWVAQVDILKMVCSIFNDKKIPLSKSMYIKKLNLDSKEDIKYHIFCDECESHLGEKEIKMKEKHCKICKKDVKVSSPSNFFVTLSIESQLQKFLQDEKFVSNVMNYRFNRQSAPGVLSDIYDGKVYQELSADEGILSSPYNFSYSFFTDGVQFGKSSNKTIWPIYLTVNELPYEERSKYFILAGVYAGSKDPNQRYFFKPFVTAANKLSEEGFSWVHLGRHVKSRFIPLCFVADSVARYQFLNYQSFGAYFGCTFCYKKSVPQRGGNRYIVSEPAPDRTDESLKEDLFEVYKRKHEVQDKNRVYRGVKGPCNLMYLNYFSVSSSCVVDYMHAVLVGVVKTHTELILQSVRKKMWLGMDDERIGMDHLIASIDNKIKAIQSNSAIIRELRPLKDFALWKASEFLSWLLFYAIPCLTGFLKDKYILHLGMLSKATFMLLQKSVTHEDVEFAHKLFMFYTFFFQKYFGEENMLYNVHLLSHICKGVHNFGPMWGHNSFPYESQNRYLLQLCKSPFSVAYQIARKFMIFKSLPLLGTQIVGSKRTIRFSENVLNYKKLVRYERANDKNCILLGKPVYHKFTEADKVKISEFILQGDIDYCFIYQRMLYKRKRYTTVKYSEGKENNDSCAFLKCGQCVLIKQIVKLPSTHKVILFVQKVNFDRRPLLKNDIFAFDTIKKVVDFTDLVFVKIECIDKPCLIMQGSGDSYIVNIPYGCSVE